MPSINSVFDIIQQSHRIYALDADEDEIFALVWSRAYNEHNAKNKKLIKEAICDALIDCNDKSTHKPVCITGRAARIIGALATLDFDDSLDNIQTFEMYKNQIFNEVKQIIEDNIANPDQDNIEGAKIYAEPPDKMTADDILAEQSFKDNLKYKLVKHIQLYETKMKIDDFNYIKNLCLEFVM